MEHLVVNPFIYLENFRDVLKPSGVLLLTTPNAAGIHKRARLLLGKSSYFSLEDLYNTTHEDGSLYHRHNREYTKDELVSVVLKAGFHSISAKYIAVYSPFREKLVQRPLFQRIIRGGGYFVTTLIPSLRDTLLVAARVS
jgi:hypothetical protein